MVARRKRPVAPRSQPPPRARRLSWPLLAGGVLLLLGAVAVWVLVARPITLPAPRQPEPHAAVSRADFVGAERCQGCHASQYAAWSESTHGRAGGAPSPRTVLAPFGRGAIVFANARVTPRVRGDAYEFLVEQPGEPARVLRVDGVIGGGHIYGGGTQGFVSAMPDGTLRFLPFEWSRQAGVWFCNTNSRSGKGWTPIDANLRLEECGDWPPIRVIGDNPRYANCQSCHASQATSVLDSVERRFRTTFTSLAINCESCHGPARRHVELAESGHISQRADIGLASLATLDKDASLRVCYACHAVKDELRPGYLSGDTLARFYSTTFPLLGDRPLFPDGRVRTFAYQEGHQYSDCYLNGGMTCTSCHDPHDQRYRDVNGAVLRGRFDDRQCTSCHAGIGADPVRHTHHGNPNSVPTPHSPLPAPRCTSCHMPLRQEPETRGVGRFANHRVVPYARSDHTISIPRPTADAALGLVSACGFCHAAMAVADQERWIERWWGELKPAAAVPGGPLGNFAEVARQLESRVRPNLRLEPEVAERLRVLSRSPDLAVRAAALAALHLAQGAERGTRRQLATALASARDDAALRIRWALALGYMGDRFTAEGNLADAVAAYDRALEVRPTGAQLLLNKANAQRDAGDLVGALASYQAGLALNGSDPLGWVNYGIALAAAADTTASIVALTNAATLDPGEPLAWFNLGNIAFVRGDLVRAATLYERTAALDPSISQAHMQLARVSLLRRDERAALGHLRRGLAFDSSDASAREMRAAIEERLRTGAAAGPP